MTRSKRPFVAVVRPAACVAAAALLVAASGPHDITTYAGICDASAAVALDGDYFLVAEDEHDRLMTYRRGQRDAIGPGVDLAAELGNIVPDKNGKPEAVEGDIEGAARVGNRIYWITSHGLNKNAKARPTRLRFFANDLDMSAPVPTVRLPLVGVYKGLLADLKQLPGLGQRLIAVADRAPNDGGINIEGLAAGPKESLLIGFRSPLIDGKAIVVPLLNPDELLTGKAAHARFGTPVELEIGGGVRSLEAVGGRIAIVAGPVGDEAFKLSWWSVSDPNAGEAQQVALDLRPEALFAFPGRPGLYALSDDGDMPVDALECKDKNTPPARKSFRGWTVD